MKKLFSTLLLILLLIGVSIGYAVLSSNLSITGTSIISKQTWDIHFENIQTKSDSITPTSAAAISNQGKTVTYSVSLNTPGEYYEFNVDVKNAGTIDGMIESVTSTVNNQPISNLPSYIEYYVTYSDGVEIQPNHLLTAGSKETYTVHIGFKKNISVSDLPSSNQTFNLSFGFIDTQADVSAIPKPNYIYSITGNALRIGSTTNLNSPYNFDNYQDAIDSLRFPVFLRFNMQNNVITEISLGFIYNDVLYYMPVADGGSSYNANKELLNGIFGLSNCIEEDTGNYIQYVCTSNPYRVRTQSDGGAGGSNKNNGIGCAINGSGVCACVG